MFAKIVHLLVEAKQQSVKGEVGTRMTRSQGIPLTKDEIQRIQMLLSDTSVSMTMIAERMNCTRSSIARINKELQIRSYQGRRSTWAIVG